MNFNSELEMSQAFRNNFLLNVEAENVTVLAEVKGLSGIPDYVLFEHDGYKQFILSFELKLHNWKRALQQAFRYRTFANISYVILDESRSSSAIRNIEYFKKYNIGLATFSSNGQFSVFFHPLTQLPFSSKYSELLKNILILKSSVPQINDTLSCQRFLENPVIIRHLEKHIRYSLL